MQWTVTFSEPVIGVDVSDFALVSTGTLSGGSVTNVSGRNSTYTATANTGTGEGTLRLDLVDNDTITDGVGNELGGAGAGNGDFTSGQVFVIDRTGPSVTVDQKSGQADPTNALPILWTVTFNEPVTGFDASDLTRGGTATGGNVAVTGSGASYEIALTNPGTNLSNGTISFTIAASKAQDAAGNDNTASTSTDNTVTYDTVPPSVTVNQKSGQPDPTNALPILWTVTFKRARHRLRCQRPDAWRNGDRRHGRRDGQRRQLRDLPRRTPTNGTDQLRDRSQHGAGRCRQQQHRVDEHGQHGHLRHGGAGGDAHDAGERSFTNDSTPALSGAAGNASGDGAIVTVRIYSGPDTSGALVHTSTPTRVGAAWNTTATTLAQGTYTAQATQTDTATNVGTSSANTFVVDTTPPTVTINQKSGQADPTNALPILWTVTFSEPVTGFVVGDLSRTGSSGTSGAFAITGSGANYEISVTGSLANGTTAFTLPANRVNDLAGNTNTAASTSTDNTVTYDTVAPTVTINQKSGQADPTNALPILWTVTFSEPVTGFDAGDLTRGGTTAGGSVAVTGSGTSYEIALTNPGSNLTNGTTSFTIVAGSAQDAAGNGNTASTSTDNTVTYDTVAPTLTLLEMLDADTTARWIR